MDPVCSVHCPYGHDECALATMVQEEIERASHLPFHYRERRTRAFSDYGQPLPQAFTEIEER